MAEWSMTGRAALLKGAGAALAATLLPVLSACSVGSDPRADNPDATVAFVADWQAAADCSAQQLGQLYPIAQLTHHPDRGYAEIVVSMWRDTTSSYAAGMLSSEGLPTAGSMGYADNGMLMIIDVRDVGPRQAEARIYASRYMLLPGGPTTQAAAAMASCRTGTAAASSQRPVVR
jgi:hypothetical protein